MVHFTHIMSFLKKTFTRKDVLIILGLIVAYFVTRLIRIEDFPIFGDEGIYINWAKIAWKDASWRFISLTDGRQPLQTWGTIPFLKLTADNYLLGGRLFSVATGLGALVGLGSLLYYLWGKRAALIGMILYITLPYFLFYDRMALMDSGVNAFFIWMLFLSVVLIRTQRLDIALLFGLLGGLASLSKSTVRIFFLAAGFAPVLIFSQKWKSFLKDAVNYYILFAIGSALAFVIYNVQRLSQFFHYVSQKNTTFVMSFDEFLKTPFAYLGNNLFSIPQYVAWEMGFVVAILGIGGFYYLYQKDKRLFWYLLTWIVVPYIIISFFAKVLYPRYVIYLGSVLVITASYYLSTLKCKHLRIYVLLIVLSILPFVYSIWFDHEHIPFPPVDRGQYIEGWPAGWGAREIMDYAKEKAQEKRVILLTQGTFGMSGDVMEVLKGDDPRITIKGYWPLEKENIEENMVHLTNAYVFVVFSHETEFPEGWPIEKIHVYERPGDEARMALFRVVDK